MWTLFWDMSSGGSTKEYPYEHIYIESDSQEQAEVVFYNRFGHSPHRVTCTCCGPDYDVSSNEDIEQLSGFHRGCVWNNERKGYGSDSGISLECYFEQDNVFFIYSKDIEESEKVGEVPEEGYVWL